ncbi:hypothetical protein C8A01DRAFT_21367 [Parachaetomium inaequale]|uniref:Uncharacterized protein n=1 Tax=Parachaetomium inaequale TaxID=2588326 RepID=A0AAN6P7Y7_9PEZI|nr:hypothetical protein C8A01DRAFT_21367 [Parachaetomium inaequale]
MVLESRPQTWLALCAGETIERRGTAGRSRLHGICAAPGRKDRWMDVRAMLNGPDLTQPPWVPYLSAFEKVLAHHQTVTFGLA